MLNRSSDRVLIVSADASFTCCRFLCCCCVYDSSAAVITFALHFLLFFNPNHRSRGPACPPVHIWWNLLEIDAVSRVWFETAGLRYAWLAAGVIAGDVLEPLRCRVLYKTPSAHLPYSCSYSRLDVILHYCCDRFAGKEQNLFHGFCHISAAVRAQSWIIITAFFYPCEDIFLLGSVRTSTRIVMIGVHSFFIALSLIGVGGIGDCHWYGSRIVKVFRDGGAETSIKQNRQKKKIWSDCNQAKCRTNQQGWTLNFRAWCNGCAKRQTIKPRQLWIVVATDLHQNLKPSSRSDMDSV